MEFFDFELRGNLFFCILENLDTLYTKTNRYKHGLNFKTLIYNLSTIGGRAIRFVVVVGAIGIKLCARPVSLKGLTALKNLNPPKFRKPFCLFQWTNFVIILDYCHLHFSMWKSFQEVIPLLAFGCLCYFSQELKIIVRYSVKCVLGQRDYGRGFLNQSTFSYLLIGLHGSS